MILAVDTQILLRNAARRMLFGAAEFARIDVIVPETAALFAKMHYAKVARHYVENTVIWDDEERATPWTDTERAAEIARRLKCVFDGFAQWIDDEAARNDGMFTIAPRTAQAATTAMEIADAGVVNDPGDERWEIGEDPFVLAEALEAGAHWVASDNFRTLDGDAMEQWLDDVQRRGRFPHVPRPFILSAENAVHRMVESVRESLAPAETLSPREATRMLANAVSRPHDTSHGSTERRVQILARMGKDIRRGGLKRTGRALHEWQLRKTRQIALGKAALVETEIAWMDACVGVSDVQHTRAAEDRRRQAERWTRIPPGLPPVKNTIERC